MSTVAMKTEETLMELREEREKLINRIDVLEKVKSLLLLPALEMATTQQVADFYEVDVNTLYSTINYHKEELVSDGYKSMRGKEVITIMENSTLDFKGLSITKAQGGYLVNGEYKLAYAGVGLFPKRAILRIGMLLRDSEVAKEVRTQLLNIEENATNEIRTKEADTELSIIELEVGKAFATGDIKEFAEASIKLVAYKNRHIEKVESKLKEAETTVDILTHEFKTLDKKQLLKKLVNTLAFTLDKPQGKVWTYVYAELMYKTGAVVKKRAKVGGSYLNALTEEELDVCISSASILAKKHNITLSNEVDLI